MFLALAASRLHHQIRDGEKHEPERRDFQRGCSVRLLRQRPENEGEESEEGEEPEPGFDVIADIGNMSLPDDDDSKDDLK